MTFSADEKKRYKRHLLLPEIGGQGQNALRRAKVLVIGAGGLGCPILTYLAAAGIGTIGICDPDTIDVSNLQRQTLYSSADIGKPKAVCAAGRLRALNPHPTYIIHEEELTRANADTLIFDYDLIIEGVDRYASRYTLNTACLIGKKPFISSSIGRFDGQVALFEPGVTNRPCYACFVPEPPTDEDQCASEGVLGATPGVVGALAASESIKWICNIQPTLSGNILIYSGLLGTTRRTGLLHDPECQVCGT